MSVDWASVWQPYNTTARASQPGDVSYVKASEFKATALNTDALTQVLSTAPLESSSTTGAIEVALADPKGQLQRFSVFESPIMDPELQAKYSNIRTYAGQGIDDPLATVRFDVTPLGLHAQVLTPNGRWYIDPYYHLKTNVYASYEASKTPVSGSFGTGVDLASAAVSDVVARAATTQSITTQSEARTGSRSSGTQLRTYRTAVAATAEYTAFFGGTVALGQAAIVTAINRVNQIYEQDLSVRLQLVANNDVLVFTNSASDPYTDINNTDLLITQNQSAIDTAIGNSSYDIGHVFTRPNQEGGLAELASVGDNARKAQGGTGLATPNNDVFYVDFVAHEMGHQFGAEHTFNGSDPNLTANRDANSAFEPGSGSTIMGYAGVGGSDNLQPNSDAYFHSRSLDQIIAYLDDVRPTVGTRTATGNTIPTVNAGANFAIPTGTPFVLTATGADADNDTLTYTWEQRDLGPVLFVNGADNGQSPLFRSFSPTTDSSRTFPRLSDLVNNTTTIGEKLPTVERPSMDFRVTVRDNRPGGGAVNSDDMFVNVVNTGAPFQVTSQNSPVSWPANSTQTITWDVAGTTGNGINTDNVRILLSTDGGLTYPTVLSASETNDGSADITVPFLRTSAGRVRVEAIGNIFFDISNANLSIVDPVWTSFTNNIPITIPESGSATPFPSNISVSGLTGVVTDVNVRLNGFSHRYASDVDILLVGPQGQTALLVSDTGKSGDVPASDIGIDDDVGGFLPENGAYSTGTYRVTNYDDGEGSDVFDAPAPPGSYGGLLADFDFSDPNGTWSLYVRDDTGPDGGLILGGWTIEIQTAALPTVSLQASSNTISENDSGTPVFATLSQEFPLDVTVNLDVTGNAILGADYNLTPGNSVVIPAGQLQGDVFIAPIPAVGFEPNEDIFFEIASVLGGIEDGVQQQTVTIVDADPIPLVSLSATTTTYDETSVTMSFVASIPFSYEQDVIIALGFAGTAGSVDYFEQAEITIPAGLGSSEFSILLFDDDLDEFDETVEISIISVTNAFEDGDQKITFTIVDNDNSPTISLSANASSIVEEGGAVEFTASLSEPSGRDVTVTVGLSGTADDATDYTVDPPLVILAGQTSATFTLTATQDIIDEFDESVIVDIDADFATELTPQQVTITILDDENPPTDVSLSNTTIFENAGANAVVGTISGTDPDPGAVLTFSLPIGVTDNNSFNINGTSLRANASLNFEQKSSFVVTVRATDEAGLTFDKPITITVANVNEAPSGANTTQSFAEDSVFTFSSANFGFTDVDVPVNTLSRVKIVTLPAVGSLTLNNVAVTLGQSITVANINSGLLKFTPVGNTNGNNLASFAFQVEDNGGTANGGVNLDPTPNTLTFNVTPVNDVPVVTLPTAAISYTENAAGLLVFTGATATDSDLPVATVTTATLTVTNTNGEGTDRLQIIPSGVYTVVGNELRANNAAIATFAGGTGTTPLVLTFTANMARIQAAIGLIGFSSTSDAPSTTPRVLSVVLTDSASGSSVVKTRTVGITTVNDAPVITLPSTAITYVENAGPLLVFTGATAVDPDLANATATTATLTVTNTNAESTDRLTIVPSGVYTVVGTELRAVGVAIATFTGGSGTTPLVLTFTTNMARIQAAIGLIGLSSTSESPSTIPRVLTVRLTDAASANSIVRNRTVSVTSVNDVPVVTLPNTAISYTENAGALLTFTGSTATDADLAAAANTTATLTVTNTNGEGTDRLTIVPSGVYTVVGTELRANNVAIATFTGGTGTTPLVLSFTTNMARIQAAIGLIGFSSTSDAPSTTPRVLSVVLKDAANASSVVKTRTVGVTSVNDVPVVTLPTTPITYVENASPLLLFTGATAVDADLATATVTTATLTVTNTNAESTDRLTIVPSGVYSVVGSELRANGLAIATFTGGTGTTPLVLNFTANMARIQAAIGLIGFSSTSQAPSTTPRVVTVRLTDATAGNSILVNRTVSVTSVNDVPTVTVPTNIITYIENAAPLLMFTGATATDVDLAIATPTTATLTVTNTNGEATDQLSIVPSGVYTVFGSQLRANNVTIATFTGGNGLTPLVISFTTNMARIQAAIGLIGFSSSSDAPLVTPRTISVQLKDAANGLSVLRNRSVELFAVNDAPLLALGLASSVSYTRNTSAIVVAPAATLTDLDLGNYLGGSVKIQADSSNSSTNRVALSGSYSINGSNEVLFNGNVIGNATSNGVGANPLTITFNATSTPAIVQGLIRSVTYRTVGASSAFSVALFFTVSDQSSNSGEKTAFINVT